MSMKYIRTFALKSDGGEQRIHVGEGVGDSYTLCGFDVAGDLSIHRKPPEELSGKRRVTCQHCLQIIEIVKNHLKFQATD